MSTVDLPIRFRHYATRLDDFVLFFGGFSNADYSALHSWHEICLYDAINETIQICAVEGGQENFPTATCSGCAVNIGSDIYTFGGEVIEPGRVSFMNKNSQFDNTLWKLLHKERNTKPYEEKKYTFEWSEMKIEGTQMPAPRSNLSAWEHGGCVWIFGGISNSKEFIKGTAHFHYGDLSYVDNDAVMAGLVLNKQLFRYDPDIGSKGKWEYMNYVGDAPSPRADSSTARVNDHVWLYGGLTNDGSRKNDFYQLDMQTLRWSRIETGEPVPKLSYFHTLNQLSENVILLYGGFAPDVPWFFNISSKKWTKLDIEQYRGRMAYTATTTGNAVIIIGGNDGYDQNITHVVKLIVDD